MILRHSTPRKNLASIVAHGLLTSKSQGKLKAVWLCSPERTSWAVLHVAKRHGARVEGIVTLEISVPRSWLRRNRRGTWYCTKDIPPERIARLFTFAAVAAVA